MKQQYIIRGVDTRGVELLNVLLRCTQHQVARVRDAFAFAMATDGDWKFLRVTLKQRDGGERDVYATEFKGARHG